MTYNLSEPAGAHRTEIENKIQTIISPYRYVRKLSTFYIIHVDNQVAWQNILDLLSNLSRTTNGRLLFIMSPLMSGGNYNGMLQSGEWNDINELTNLDA